MDKKVNVEGYSVMEVSRALGVSRNTIYRWIKAGKLPALRIGVKYIITDRDIEELMRVYKVKTIHKSVV